VAVVLFFVNGDVGYMKKSIVFALVLLSSGSLTASKAFAEPAVSYSYGQLSYVSQNLDDFDCTQDGLAVEGSYAVNNEFFVVGSFADVSGGGCGSSTYSAGAGYRIAYTEDLSLYASLAIENTSVDFGDSESGLIVSVGGRGYVMENLEARVSLSRHSSFNGSTVLSGGVNYWFDQQFAVTGDLSFGSESTGVAVGVRMNF